MAEEGAFERAVAWTERLLTGRAVSTTIICDVSGVSRATAKRDMLRLEALLPVIRKGHELWLMDEETP